MLSLADLNEYRQAQEDIATLARRDTAALWQTLAGRDDAEWLRDALLAEFPELVADYGEMSAVVASDFYDVARAEASVRRPYASTLADSAPADEIAAAVRWSMGPMFGDGGGSTAVLGRLLAKTEVLTLSQGDWTLFENMLADPSQVRYAWVPAGACCAYCTLMASRGAVFATRDTASSHRHANCRCRVVPSWADGDIPDYDQARYEALYEQALDEVTPELRAQFREKYADGTNAAGVRKDPQMHAVMAAMRRQGGVTDALR